MTNLELFVAMILVAAICTATIWRLVANLFLAMDAKIDILKGSLNGINELASALNLSDLDRQISEIRSPDAGGN